jgi:hypothetical protein
MRFTVGEIVRDVELDAIIVAGYTGRDRAKVQEHIDELAEIGVPPPPSFPTYWLLPPWLATSASEVVVAGERTSGEAELALVADGDELFVTLASDHTDRAAEAVDIELSKAICPVPIATEAWPAAEVDGHWDELVLRSWIDEDDHDRRSGGGGEAGVPYQDAPCAALVPPLELLAGYSYTRPVRLAMLTGTVPVIGDIRPSSRFRAELHDPVHERSIVLAYDVRSLADLKH